MSQFNSRVIENFLELETKTLAIIICINFKSTSRIIEFLGQLLDFNDIIITKISFIPRSDFVLLSSEFALEAQRMTPRIIAGMINNGPPKSHYYLIIFLSLIFWSTQLRNIPFQYLVHLIHINTGLYI